MLNSAPTPPSSTRARWHAALREVAGRPGLSDGLTHPAGDLVLRFGETYSRLAALPRAHRRRLQRRLGVGLAGAALLLTLGLAPQTALAATITVNGDGTGSTCSLADAITAANSDMVAGNCVAGSGADTIDLQNGVVLTAPLPDVSSEIVLEGNRNAILRTSGDVFGVLKVTDGGSLVLRQTTISGGSAVSGGGIFNAGTLTLQESTVSGNTASSGGGGIFNLGTLEVQNSTLYDNHSADRGGGIYNYYGTATLENSTISGNFATAGNGGGIYNRSGGTMNVANSTITGNSVSTGYGGGIYNAGTVTVQNSIIAQQAAGEDCAGYLSNIYSAGFNIESAQNCFSLNPGDGDWQLVTEGDLRLGSLGDHGGPTQTHPLNPGSIAIDQVPVGTNDCMAGFSTDQRGAARSDGAGRGGTGCDIGAYEYDSAQNPTAVTLRELAAARTSPAGWLPALGASLVAGLGLLTWRRRSVGGNQGAVDSSQ